jgi:hypothetical protein
MSRFQITRENGQSDAEVLSGVVDAASNGALLSYQDLSDALSAGASRVYGMKEVQSAVRRAERKLATEHCKALINVRNLGYRIALAGEHQKIAGRKRDRASSLLKRGLMILQHVDWDEMDQNTRQAHEGQLMVIGALHSAMQGLDSRMRRIESAIDKRNDTKD